MAIGVYCDNCKHKELIHKFDKWPCMDCCDGDRRDPFTNADRIRAMTDEELAFLIAWNSYDPPPWCREHEECPFIGLDHVPCEECALDWLKQEAEE